MMKFLRKVFGAADPKPHLGDTTINYWRESHGKWNWDCRDGNHEVVSQSTQGYDDLQGCLEGIDNARDAMARAVIVRREVAP